MKMFKIIPVFILLFAESHRAELCPPVMFQSPYGISWNFCFNRRGYLCNAQEEETTTYTLPPKELVPPRLTTDSQGSDPVPAGRSLPTLVVAGVSIALVLLCILIVAIFWYAWKKSQEGSIELNPIPYGEAGVSLRSLSGPENQQEWPFERAVQ